MTSTTTLPAPAGTAGEERPEISRSDARLVLQHFGYAVPGPDGTKSFRGRLLALIAEADVTERRALARSYPALVAAVQLARTSPTGIDTLHAIAAPR